MKIKKGDKVKVMVGKDNGKEATVERVFLSTERLLLPGIGMYKKHVKPRGEGQKGSIVEANRAIGVSKVALICPKCKKITRVGNKIIGDKRVRICKKCDQEV